MPRRVELTRRGGTILGAAIGLLVAGRMLGTVELVMLGLTALTLLIVGLLWVRARRVPIHVVRQVRPIRVQAGTDARVDLELTNDGPRSTPQTTVTDHFDGGRRVARFLAPALQPAQQARAAYRVPTAQRGRYTIGPLTLGVGDPFGLAHREWETGRHGEIIVTPRIHEIRPPFGAAGRTRSSSPFRATFHTPAPDGEDFLTLRDYAPGDDLRRIHWRSTARTGELFVRQDETRWEPRIFVLLDTREVAHDAESFEAAVEAAASIVARLGRSGERFEVLTSAGRELVGALRQRRSAAEPQLMDVLAEIQPTAEIGIAAATAALRPDRRRGLLIAVMGSVDPVTRSSLFGLASTAAPIIMVTTREAPGISTTGRITMVDGRRGMFPAAWDAAMVRRPRPHAALGGRARP